MMLTLMLTMLLVMVMMVLVVMVVMIEKRTKNGPRGLPEASLGPPGAISEDMQRNAKKQEKQKGSPDLIFQKNVKFTDPGWTPKSSRSGPESENKVENDVFVDAPVGVTVLGGFFHRFAIDFSCFFSMRVFLYFSTVSKNGKVLKTL